MATGRKNPLRGRVVRISDDRRLNVDRGTVLELAPAGRARSPRSNVISLSTHRQLVEARFQRAEGDPS